MCEKCKEIDVTIARYRRLRNQVNDQQTRQAADDLIAKLEAEKCSLLPEKLTYQIRF
jgi:hypothetical protein